MDVASAMIGNSELEPAVGGEADLLGVGDRSLVEDVVSLANFAGRIVSNHPKIGAAMLG